MADYKLGPYRLRPRGEFDPDAFYKYLDVVSYNGSSYVVKNDDLIDNIAVMGVLPEGQDNSEVYWALLASKGEPGATGEAAETYKPFMEVINGDWDFNITDKITIPAVGATSITIRNAYDGCIGVIVTDKELSLPAGSDFSIDFDYVSRRTNQYYIYTFIYGNPDGANARFIWNRTVVNKS